MRALSTGLKVTAWVVAEAPPFGAVCQWHLSPTTFVFVLAEMIWQMFVKFVNSIG